MPPPHRSVAAFGALLLAALAVVAPFAVRGVACGHDLVFHMNGWLEVAQQWHQGIVYPRWAANANFGSGEPRFLFYPPLSCWLGAALGSFVPWWFVPVAFDICAVMLAGGAMFTLARAWFGPLDAVLIAVAYAVNPYMLLTIYARSAFAEMLAASFLPLLVLWMVRDRPARSLLVPLALTIAGIWLTDVPAAIIASYLAVLLLVIVTACRRNSRVILFGIAAIALGLALAAFYIVPVLHERNWITPAQLLSPGVRPFENFLFARTGDPEHDAFLRMVSWLAVGEIAVTVLAVFGAQRWRKPNPKLWWSLAVPACFAVLLMLPIAVWAYRLMPDLQFLQFPWRWLLVVSLAYAVFVVTALSTFRGKAWLYAILFLGLIAGCNRAFQPQCDPAETPVMLFNLYHTGYGYMGTDEYTPAGGDNYEIKPDFPEYRLRSDNGDAAAKARVTKLHTAIYRKQLTVESPDPVELVLRLMNYPAWRVTVNGKPVEAQSDDPTGRMIIALPQGHSDVDVQFTRTPDRWLGDGISLAALFLLVGILFTTEARRARRQFRQGMSGFVTSLLE